MRALLIAEKTSEMNIIKNVYLKHKSEFPFEIDFLSQAGHLFTLKLPNEIDEEYNKWCWEHLPFHPENKGGWKYKIITGTTPPASLAKGKYEKIKDALKTGKYNFIIHAGDADQEGQLLVDIVLKELNYKLPVKRYWSNDTTDIGVVKALNNLIDYKENWQENLLAAAYGRQHSDYRFGMNLSEAASLKMNTNVAVGRVKTPMLSIVCQREDKIANFKPSTTYGVKAVYDTFTGQLFSPKKEDKEDKKEDGAGLIYFDTKKEAEEFISTLGDKAVVTSYEMKKVETFAPKLYKLATLQVDAGKIGYSPSQTLDIVQSLYLKGYVSYPRTDCECIASGEDFYALIKSSMSVPGLEVYIKTISKTVIEKVKNTKKWVNDAELKSHGHSALIPTNSKPDFSKLETEEKTIYEMICKRFIAIFLPPVIQDKVTLITDINGNEFKSNGKVLISEGYAKLFGIKFTDMEIPEYKKDDIISVNKYECIENTSKCPNHITESELIGICENPLKYLTDDKYKSLGKNLKIGTSATRASIIKMLILKDKYLETKKIGKKEYLIPTDKGRMIYENLKFCKICRVDLTGEWEIELDKVRNGMLNIADFEKYMINQTNLLVEDIKKATMATASKDKSLMNVICKCPECGGDVLSGKKGFFCSNWKEKSCKFGAYKIICDSTITDEEFKGLIEGKTIEKKIKKDSSVWLQKLKFNKEENKIEFVTNETKTEYICPSCKNKVTDNGNMFKCNCGFRLYKSVCGKVLTKIQINNLFDKGTTGIIKNLKSKAGKSFDAEIIISDDCKGTVFKFPERK